MASGVEQTPFLRQLAASGMILLFWNSSISNFEPEHLHSIFCIFVTSIFGWFLKFGHIGSLILENIVPKGLNFLRLIQKIAVILFEILFVFPFSKRYPELQTSFQKK